MAITVTWDDEENTIIVWTFTGRWTWAEFERAIADTDAMLETVEHKVVIIADVTESSLFPVDVLYRVRQQYMMPSSKVCMRLAVGADALVELLWRTFAGLKAPHLAIVFVPTMQAARAYIANNPCGDT